MCPQHKPLNGRLLCTPTDLFVYKLTADKVSSTVMLYVHYKELHTSLMALSTQSSKGLPIGSELGR